MDLFGHKIFEKVKNIFAELENLDEKSKIDTINAIRSELHRYSPFRNEPVDCIQWVSVDEIQANDYNPNQVAPPEMKLLEHSISMDGYTQPIVAWKNQDNFYEVVDGFHRNRVGRESENVSKRIMGYLPLTIIKEDRTKRNDRIAATIRHNRARGKHHIDGMAEIVLELKRRNWTDKKISKELGMDPDEVLRLSQITGLADMFKDQEFSEAWEADLSDTINEKDDLEVAKDDPNE